VHLHEVENPLLEVVKHADLHCEEEVGLWEFAHDPGNMSTHVESSVTMARLLFGIGCLGVRITERFIWVVIPPEVSLVRRDIISKLVLWTLVPETNMPLGMMY